MILMSGIPIMKIRLSHSSASLLVMLVMLVCLMSGKIWLVDYSVANRQKTSDPFFSYKPPAIVWGFPIAMFDFRLLNVIENLWMCLLENLPGKYRSVSNRGSPWSIYVYLSFPDPMEC